MAWFRLDDQGAFHAKVLRAGNEAYGAWTRAGQWSSGHMTEGLIPRDVALTIAPLRVWKKLVAAGLVDATGDDFQIHDYLDWNPSADDVVAKRAARAEAGRRGGLSKAANHQQAASSDVAIATPVASSDVAIATPVAKQNSAPSPSPSPSPEEDPPKAPQGAQDRIEQGTSSADAAANAFMSALEEVGYSRQPLKPRERGLLGDALNRHLIQRRGMSIGQAIDELPALIRRWAKPERAAFAVGWSVGKFVEWLDAGMPEAHAAWAKPIAKGTARQPPAEDASWRRQ